jgi:hypothetical protein
MLGNLAKVFMSIIGYQNRVLLLVQRHQKEFVEKAQGRKSLGSRPQEVSAAPSEPAELSEGVSDTDAADPNSHSEPRAKKAAAAKAKAAKRDQVASISGAFGELLALLSGGAPGEEKTAALRPGELPSLRGMALDAPGKGDGDFVAAPYVPMDKKRPQRVGVSYSPYAVYTPNQEALQLLLMQNPPPPWVTDANQWYPESYNTIPKGLRPSETLKAGTGTAGGVTGTYKTRVSAGAPINANASGPRPCERQAVNRRPLSAGHMPSSGLNNMRANRGKVTRLVENQYKEHLIAGWQTTPVQYHSPLDTAAVKNNPVLMVNQSTNCPAPLNWSNI